MTIDLASMITTETRARIFDRMVQIAESIGLSTESWQPGDPTRSTMYAEAGLLETLEAGIAESIRGGFIRLARGAWKTLNAFHVYNVDRIEARRATCSVTLTNGSTTNYGAIDLGDLIVRNSVTGATYRNTSGGTLGGLGTLVLDVEAEDPGTVGSSAIGEIDELVTALPGVTVANTTAAVGVDEESEAALEARCLAKLGSLSPNGPRGAYEYVATTPELTDGAEVNRVRVVDANALDGQALVYVAGPSGAVSGGDVAKVQAAIDANAVPIGFRATVSSASAVAVNLSPTVYVYDTIGRPAGDVADELEDVLAVTISERAIGGDDGGFIYGSALEAALLNAVAPHGFRVSSISDVALTSSQVAVPGSINVTVTIVGSP